MKDKILRRYTQLPALFCILAEKKLTLLDPRSWDDTNDSSFLAQYKSKCKFKTLLALCFSTAPETYHHWSVFADGSAGVCIQFKRDELMAALKGHAGIRCRDVDYLPIKVAEGKKLKIKDLPFTKRYPFQDECEWRVIYESQGEKKSAHDIPIPLSSIARVTLSPWLPEALKDHVMRRIMTI